jgi:CheY-like chemotaxis protein
VVLDIRMPGIDGLETMARLLSRENTLPVILNTAYSAYRESFLSWSADAYVIKSSDLTELKTKIREVLAARAADKGSPPS